MTDELLPVGQRPKCRACGRELRPNFTRDKGPEKTVRDYTRKDYRTGKSVYDAETFERPIVESDHGAQQAKDGRWFVERVLKTQVRRFLGSYGAYKDGLFCGLGCAYRWAVGVCEALDKKGERWNTYTKKES